MPSIFDSKGEVMKIFRIVLSICIFSLFFSPEAAALTPLFQLEEQGNFKIDSLRFGWILYPPGWNAVQLDRNSFRMDKGFPVRSADSFKATGKWAGFKVSFSAVAQNAKSIDYRASFHAEPAVKAAQLALVSFFSTTEEYQAKVNGKPFVFPKHFKNKIHLINDPVKSFSFTFAGKEITFSGDFQLLIQDDRQWGIDRFIVRISPRPYSGLLTDTELRANIRFLTPETCPVDLRNAANRDFRDAEIGLPMIPSGRMPVVGADFEIIDPAANGNRSCIALAAAGDSAEVTVNSPIRKEQYLYLLHAVSGKIDDRQKAGVIDVEFADGSKKSIPVVAGNDLGSSLAPFARPNGAVAWIAETPASVAGLYLSQFKLEKAPRRLTFRADSGEAVWLIAAVTLGDRKLPLDKVETPFYLVEDHNWTPLEFSGRTRPGSPLDFSRYVETPAGKYGEVIVDAQGHFVFRNAPEKRIRFFGPNLIGSALYVKRDVVDSFIDKAYRLGYNTVRFHHFEDGLIDFKAAESPRIRPGQKDKLDYIFAEMKKHGMYLTIDLYASRTLLPADNIAEHKKFKFRRFDHEMKRLLPVSPSAMENWKKFARELLTSVNPYTGLSWAEDPALFSVNLVNENPLVQIWDTLPQLVPLYLEKYAEFLKSKGLDTPENRASRGGLFIEFLTKLQIDCIREQRRFLREELKLKALITDMNMTSKYTLIEPRAELDFIDNHRYWDHPEFTVTAWELPYLFSNTSSISRNAANPRGVMSARQFGKPYTITEFNFCNPNPYRMEGGLLYGAYAGLQDWDGLYRFAWSHYGEYMESGVPVGFDIVNDPLAQMEERLLQMLFVRGDVSPAKHSLAFTVKPEQLRALTGSPNSTGAYPDAFSELGLFTKIGSMPDGAALPGIRNLYPLEKGWQKQLPRQVRSAMENWKHTGILTSESGEIRLDTRKLTLQLATPLSEAAVFRGGAAMKVMRLSNGNRYQMIALTSLDDKPLRESNSLLLMQLPNIGANKQKFNDREHRLLAGWGERPLLTERALADVELALSGNWQIEALKTDGTAAGTIPAVIRDGKVCFTVKTDVYPGGILAYHLTRKK